MQCITPLTIRLNDSKGERSIPVPCGKCPACYKRRASQWSFRLMQQQKVSQSSYFITLTYDTDHVPITPNLFLSLRYRDLQLYFKRVRKAHDQHAKATNTDAPRIKYYAVGEYGAKSKRPHYHVLVFDCKLELMFEKNDLLYLQMSMNGKTQFKAKHWDHGMVTVGAVNIKSVGYCLKYMSKVSQVGRFERDDRKPEKALMSKGLGANYLTPQMIEYHRNDILKRMYCMVEGKKVSMPRYYKNRIYNEQERNKVHAYIGKMLEAEFKDLSQLEARNLAEGHKAMFRKMEKDHYQNRSI